MKNARNFSFAFPKTNCFWLVAFSIAFLSLFPLKATSQDAISAFDSIFGSPDEFVSSFQNQVSGDIDQYAGTAIAITGFILVLRSL